MDGAAPHHPRVFSDVYRGLRALLIGTAVTVALMRRLPLDEAFSVGFLSGMAIDLLMIARISQHMSAMATRQVFAGWRANRSLLVERTVLLAFMSIGLLSLSVHDVHSSSSASILPTGIRILVYFAALFTTWMQLHIGFAIYYAKHYFSLNPTPAADGPDPQGFVFTGGDEPVFTDFLYVAFAVGLTYAMSDVNLEDSRMRRMVLLHSIISFLFYSTVISAVLNLMTTG
ncbi:MAG: DUF1345 domain-containing protein [Synechococcaceae bacterium WB9_2_112]|nr:DUF1345 domain-containing protein [Synechococcaceae bacterium WB9_2_112]